MRYYRYAFSGVIDQIDFFSAVQVGGDPGNFDPDSVPPVGKHVLGYDGFIRQTSSDNTFDGVVRTLTYTDRGQVDTDMTTYSGQDYIVDTNYDHRGRIKEVVYPSTTAVQYTYTNRSELHQVNWDGQEIESRIYYKDGRLDEVNRPSRSYNELHQLESVASVTQVFNADMQMTTTHTGLTPLTWDESGQLKQVVVPGGLSVGIEGTHGYGYDASGRRVWKNKDATIEADEHLVFIYSGPNCIAEYLAGDDPSTQAPQREFVYGTSIDELLLIDTGTQQLGVTRNQQWSITALYDNSDGSVVERYTYDMFGNRRTLNSDGTEPQTPIFSTVGNPYGYTSRRHDEESGLMYFRARFYDPTTGEFISRDPLGYVDGMSLYRGYFVPNTMDPTGEKLLIRFLPSQSQFFPNDCTKGNLVVHGINTNIKPKPKCWWVQHVKLACLRSTCIGDCHPSCGEPSSNSTTDFFEAWPVVEVGGMFLSTVHEFLMKPVEGSCGAKLYTATIAVYCGAEVDAYIRENFTEQKAEGEDPDFIRLPEACGDEIATLPSDWFSEGQEPPFWKDAPEDGKVTYGAITGFKCCPGAPDEVLTIPSHSL